MGKSRASLQALSSHEMEPYMPLFEKIDALVTSFSDLTVSMRQSADAFTAAAQQFQAIADGVAPAPAPMEIDTAGPAAEKAAAADIAIAFDNFYMSMIQRHVELRQQFREFAERLTTKRIPYNILARYEEFERGCFRTIGGKHVMIYKYYAFEEPHTRYYKELGPLTPIGAINPETMRIDDSIPPPVLPTIPADWPW